MSGPYRVIQGTPDWKENLLEPYTFVAQIDDLPTALVSMHVFNSALILDAATWRPVAAIVDDAEWYAPTLRVTWARFVCWLRARRPEAVQHETPAEWLARSVEKERGR